MGARGVAGVDSVPCFLTAGCATLAGRGSGGGLKEREPGGAALRIPIGIRKITETVC